MNAQWRATIVHWHSPVEELERAADALAAQTLPCAGLHILVADDATGRVAADIRTRLHGCGVPTVVHSAPGNPGFAFGHNRLLAEAFGAGADFVVVHNPDLTLAPDAAAALAEHANTLALLGPLLQLADDGQPTGTVDSVGVRWTWDGRHLDAGQGEPWAEALDLLDGHSSVPVPGVTGAALCLNRATYTAILHASGEIFDEEFIAYREDAELCLRAARLGIPALLIPAAHGLHGRRLRGTSRGDAHVDLLGVRNRFLIAAKHFGHRPGRGPGPLLRDLTVIAAVFLVERSSLPGLRQAWRLRKLMRAKGRHLTQRPFPTIADIAVPAPRAPGEHLQRAS